MLQTSPTVTPGAMLRWLAAGAIRAILAAAPTIAAAGADATPPETSDQRQASDQRDSRIAAERRARQIRMTARMTAARYHRG